MPCPYSSRSAFAALAGAVLLLALCGPTLPDSQPLDPDAALATFQVVDGFRIEQFAAEPYVLDPVEIAFDENGGLYVAELADHPDDPPPGKPAKSRISYLEDTDGDGRVDRRTVFAENLLQVEGVMPWKGGVIATAAPDILFLKDTDGDRKADVRDVLYTGFGLGNPEGRISNPRLGLDNWIYVVNHGYPGEIRAPDRPDAAPVEVRGWDFRFDPVRGMAGTASGNGQFGLSFDEWGQAFVSQNTVHLRQAVMDARYVMRNPLLTVTGADQDISDHGRPAARIFPTSRAQQWRIDRTEARRERYAETRPGHIERLEGYFTASCGVTIYVGDAFQAEYVNNAFVTDANGNLVHRDILTPDGSTMKASRWPDEAEFVTSTDNWFRPVNFANAPDGNLYIVDYYRQYVEHPDFIPEAVQEKLRMNFYAGEDRGRIYRIVPEEPRRVGNLRPNLGEATIEELVGHLSHANGWHRRTAQRLLFEKQDTAAVPLLEKLAREGETPQARLHALWALEGLDSLKPELVRAALKDPHPGVRENALRLAERFLPELGDEVLLLADDASARVQFQLALSLGDVRHDLRARDTLAAIAARHAEDRWFRVAAVTSPPEWALPMLLILLSREKEFFAEASEGKADLLSELSRIVGARRDPKEITFWLRALAGDSQLSDAAWKQAGLEGLAAGLKLEGRTGLHVAPIEQSLARIIDNSPDQVQAAAVDVAQFFQLRSLLQGAVRDARNESLPITARVPAIRLLAGGPYDAAEPILREILTSPSPQDLQAAAAATASSFNEPPVAALLLAGWKGYGPETRLRVVAALLGRRDRVTTLLDAVDEGRIEPFAVDAVTRIKLTQYPDEAVQQRAKKLFEAEIGDRGRVVEEHRDVLDLAASAERGKEAFERECEKCHVRTAERGRIGPDLSGVNNRGKETLLSHILDPSAAIQVRYTNYVMTTKDGRVLDGLLVGETAGTVTLRGELEDVTVLRGNVEELRASTVSLMPDGLEDALTKQELADVIAYLRAGL